MCSFVRANVEHSYRREEFLLQDFSHTFLGIQEHFSPFRIVKTKEVRRVPNLFWKLSNLKGMACHNFIRFSKQFYMPTLGVVSKHHSNRDNGLFKIHVLFSITSEKKKQAEQFAPRTKRVSQKRNLFLLMQAGFGFGILFAKVEVSHESGRPITASKRLLHTSCRHFNRINQATFPIQRL